LKIAILDLYDNHANEGMRCIKELISANLDAIEYSVFDVRGKGELPDLSFDAYISSGGPGDPTEYNQLWSDAWAAWITSLLVFNQENSHKKKYALLICHSFQLMCCQLKIGKTSLRHSPSFGILPVHLTSDGLADPILSGLNDPFYTVDSRSFQVLAGSDEIEEPYKILAIEKERSYVSYERAIMAVRFSDEIIGTQFHPEADPIGMGLYFKQPAKQAQIIAEHGQVKYSEMMNSLYDPERLSKTYSSIIPSFLEIVYQHSAVKL